MSEALARRSATSPSVTGPRELEPHRPAGPVSAGDRAFAAAFESGALESFPHADHVRLAWIYLQRWPALEALERFALGLQRFAAAKGASDPYHETITWAYVLLIHERLERTGREVCWEDFAAANPDLMVWKGGLLDRWYRPETLASALAKRIFVWPDGPDAQAIGHLKC